MSLQKIDNKNTPDGPVNLDRDVILWTVAGRGTPKHETKWFSRIVACGDDIEHYTKGTPRHCRRPTCSACASYTMHRDAPEQAQRVFSMSKQAHHTDGWKYGRKLHATISIPPELYYKALTRGGYEWLKKTALRIAQQCGIVGGVLIFHPFRQNGIADDDDLDPNYQPVETNDGNKYCARFAPHFHIVGFGWIENTAEIYEKTGWVVKNIRTRDKSIKTLHDVESIILYLRSHAGVLDDSSPAQWKLKSVVYFGACGPRVMKLTAYLDVDTPQICPECGTPLQLHDVHGRNNDTTRRGPFMTRRSYPIYSTPTGYDRTVELIKDNSGYPAEILRELDVRIDLGVCALSLKEFGRVVAPFDAQTLDGTLHTITPQYGVRLKKTRMKEKPHPTVRTDHLPTKTDGFECEIWIDYHYPALDEV